MIDIPAPHAIAAIVVTVMMFYGFVSGRLSIEIVSLMTISVIAIGLYSYPLPGNRPTDGLKIAFEGFGHYALVTICALMIMGRGLVTTGALEPVTRVLTRVWQYNKRLGFLVTILLAMVMSMMVNDTPVLVLLLPILVTLASRGAMPASRTLIPINSAVLIGGMATTIGTSTNLLVVSIANDLGMKPMGIFHFTPIVIAAAAVALPFIWLVMPRLLPDNSPEAGQEPRRFRSTLRIEADSSAIGRTLTEFVEPFGDDITLTTSPDITLGARQRVGVIATHDTIEELMRTLGATVAPPDLQEQLRQRSRDTGEDIALVEVSISKESNLIGHRITDSGIGETHHVAVIGIHRALRRRGDRTLMVSNPQLAEGDILLVTGTLNDVARFARADGLLMLEGMREVPRTAKAPLALAIMLGSVGLASVGLMPIAITALGGAIVMFLTGCVKFDRVGRALSAKVIVLIAASIAIGRIMLESGAAEWLSRLIALGLIHAAPALVLAVVMVFVTILTNFASNTTAAAVGTPIAFSLAKQLGIPAEPLVLAVLFGCNLCYATPVAYQTNMLIMSAGDYKFGDYTRTGLPLVAIMIVSLSLLLVWRYGLF